MTQEIRAKTIDHLGQEVFDRFETTYQEMQQEDVMQQSYLVASKVEGTYNEENYVVTIWPWLWGMILPPPDLTKHQHESFCNNMISPCTGSQTMLALYLQKIHSQYQELDVIKEKCDSIVKKKEIENLQKDGEKLLGMLQIIEGLNTLFCIIIGERNRYGKG